MCPTVPGSRYTAVVISSDPFLIMRGLIGFVKVDGVEGCRVHADLMHHALGAISGLQLALSVTSEIGVARGSSYLGECDCDIGVGAEPVQGCPPGVAVVVIKDRSTVVRRRQRNGLNHGLGLRGGGKAVHTDAAGSGEGLRIDRCGKQRADLDVPRSDVEPVQVSSKEIHGPERRAVGVQVHAEPTALLTKPEVGLNNVSERVEPYKVFVVGDQKTTPQALRQQPQRIGMTARQRGGIEIRQLNIVDQVEHFYVRAL